MRSHCHYSYIAHMFICGSVEQCGFNNLVWTSYNTYELYRTSIVELQTFGWSSIYIFFNKLCSKLCDGVPRTYSNLYNNSGHWIYFVEDVKHQDITSRIITKKINLTWYYEAPLISKGLKWSRDNYVEYRDNAMRGFRILCWDYRTVVLRPIFQ